MKYKRFILACLVIMLQTSCTANKTIDSLNSNIQDTVSILASKNLGGRLTGTLGNEMAQELIVNAFMDIGLKPYIEESYLHEYKHIYLPPEKQKHILKIEFSKDNIKELAYGIDFLEQKNISSIDINYPIVFDLYDKNINESILIIDDLDRLSEYYKNENKNIEPKAILVKAQIFKKYLSMQEKGIPVIQVTPQVYDEFLSNPRAIVRIFQETDIQEIQAHNVIGKIEGHNNEKAIILSAHFDHVGKLSDDEIFFGAIDNASGMSALMELAKKLQLYYNENKPSYDILFCAFNGEESNLQGSRAFVKETQEIYSQIININIDSIGIKGDDILAIAGDEEVSGPLITELLNFFEQNQLNSVIEGTDLISDHISFSQSQIPSVNLGNLNIDNIHTTRDTVSGVDIKYIAQLTDVLYDFIIAKETSIFSTEGLFQYSITKNEEIESEDNNIMIAYSKAKKDMPFGSYKIIILEDKPLTVINTIGSFSDLQSIKDFYADLELPERYNGYDFLKVNIIDSTIAIVNDGFIKIGNLLLDKDSYEIGKEYKLNMDKENISRIDILYEKNGTADNNAFRITVIRSSQFKSEFESEFETKTIILGNQEYTLEYDKNTKIICGIRTEKEVSGNIYNISLLKGAIITVDIDNITNKILKSTFNIEEIESIEDFIQSIDIDYFINTIWG
ncbi:M28 family peptidase [Proteiniborus sp. MB09-C3]|uniref:M28 family metallopeptidase n=1 Tax=Proteiniborus sp. MB09-C3 TaxID=3050072 RepID=UPI0025559748|nr:M28 family peptidase [Proteiniborus sp. MB09-C3]WIV11295.1 M28 family peptidase [Proteiniborus sp. MB09-C3]